MLSICLLDMLAKFQISPFTQHVLQLLSDCVNNTDFGKRRNNCQIPCVSLAASGDLDGLEIWSLAGADLSKPGYDGQTAIQVVGSKDIRST